MRVPCDDRRMTGGPSRSSSIRRFDVKTNGAAHVMEATGLLDGRCMEREAVFTPPATHNIDSRVA